MKNNINKMSIFESLLPQIEEYIKIYNLTPPLSENELEYHTSNFRKEFCINSINDRSISILINNTLWTPIISNISYEKRVLLLPQCLRNPQKCKADFDEFGLLCNQCGECSIGELQGFAEKLGYLVVVAEGTTLVKKLLESGKIDSVIGVGCIESLEKAFDSIRKFAIPAIAVPLNDFGCISTTVDVDIVKQYLEIYSNDNKINLININNLKNDVSRLFTKSELLQYFSNDQTTTTEKITFDYLVESGKRLRPLLAIATFLALKNSSTISESIKYVAIAIECFHKASLIHDDIEDNDDKRGNSLTLHKKYNMPIALNCGDLLIGEGYRFISESHLPSKIKNYLFNAAVKCHRTLSIGQGSELLQIFDREIDLSIENSIKIFEQKTSAAFQASLTMGAITANADKETISILNEFGRLVGVAYQINDDINDLNQISKNKSFLSSIIISIAFENGNNESKEILKSYIKNGNDFQKFKTIITNPEFKRIALELKEQYQEKALQSLIHLKNIPLKSFLTKIIFKVNDSQ